MDVSQPLNSPLPPPRPLSPGISINSLVTPRQILHDVGAAKWFLREKDRLLRIASLLIHPSKGEGWITVQDERSELLVELRNSLVKIVDRFEEAAATAARALSRGDLDTISELMGRQLIGRRGGIGERSIPYLLSTFETVVNSINRFNQMACSRLEALGLEGVVQLESEPYEAAELGAILNITSNSAIHRARALRYSPEIPKEVSVFDLRQVVLDSAGHSEANELGNLPVPILGNPEVSQFLVRRAIDILGSTVQRIEEAQLTSILNRPRTFLMSDREFLESGTLDVIIETFFEQLEVETSVHLNSSVTISLSLGSLNEANRKLAIDAITREFAPVHDVCATWKVHHELYLSDNNPPKATIKLFFPPPTEPTVLKPLDIPKVELAQRLPNFDRTQLDSDRMFRISFTRITSYGGINLAYKVDTIWGALASKVARAKLYQILQGCDQLVAASGEFTHARILPAGITIDPHSDELVPIEPEDGDELEFGSGQEIAEDGDLTITLYAQRGAPWKRERSLPFELIYAPFPWESNGPQKPNERELNQSPSLKIPLNEVRVDIDAQTLLAHSDTKQLVARVLESAATLEFPVEYAGASAVGDEAAEKLLHTFLKAIPAELTKFRTAHRVKKPHLTIASIDHTTDIGARFAFGVRVVNSNGHQVGVGAFSIKDRKLTLQPYDYQAASALLRIIPDALETLTGRERTDPSAINELLRTAGIVGNERFAEALCSASSLSHGKRELIQLDRELYRYHVIDQIIDYLLDPLVGVRRNSARISGPRQIWVYEL